MCWYYIEYWKMPLFISLFTFLANCFDYISPQYQKYPRGAVTWKWVEATLINCKFFSFGRPSICINILYFLPNFLILNVHLLLNIFNLVVKHWAPAGCDVRDEAKRGLKGLELEVKAQRVSRLLVLYNTFLNLYLFYFHVFHLNLYIYFSFNFFQ